MSKLFLWFILLFKGLFKGTGADIDQLKLIVSTKLKLDDRKPIFAHQSTNKKSSSRGIWQTILTSFVTLGSGFFYILPLIVFEDNVLGGTLYYTMFMVFLSMLIVTDFSRVLVDPRDQYVLFVRPISDVTLYYSRIVHIAVYLMRIVIPMMLPGWIAFGAIFGWKAALLFPITVFLLAALVLFTVLSFYSLLLKILNPSKFKNAINNFQIVISIFIFGFYYLVPTLLNSEEAAQLTIEKVSWIKVIPSYWLAAGWLPLFGSEFGNIQWLWLALSIIAPLLIIFISAQYLAPSFMSKLSLASNSSTENQISTIIKHDSKSQKLYDKVGKLLTQSPIELASFKFLWIYSNRSRMFKMRVLPMFAYAPVFFLYLLLQGNMSIGDRLSTLHQTSQYVVLLYMTGVLMLQCASYMTYTDQYKASWVMYQAQSEHAGPILTGALKAVFVKYFLPYYITVSVFVISIWGIKVWPDLLLAFSNLLLFTLLIQYATNRFLPFSRIENIKKINSKTLITFGSLILISALGFGHYLAISLTWLKLLLLVLSGILCWMVWDSYSKTTWEQVKSDF